ncbi:MAG TPA: hypothetical protein EYM36_02045 [Acidobacteria bacterium]|nr:hypothetical protein [Acidobacteriota bacterium]
MMTGPGGFLQRLWRRLPQRHLSEDRLLALALGTPDKSTRTAMLVASHLQTCGPCGHRFKMLTALLKAIPKEADAGFRDVFTPQRLQAQRARIEHRLAHLVGAVEPARVLAFPFSCQPLRQFDIGPGRWIAAAAAIGLLLGVTAGQLIHYHPVATGTAIAADTTADAARSAAFDDPARTFDMTGTVELPPVDVDSQTQAAELTLVEFGQLMEEEGFLSTLDFALTSYQVSELASIDALTPRVRDLSINIR